MSSKLLKWHEEEIWKLNSMLRNNANLLQTTFKEGITLYMTQMTELLCNIEHELNTMETQKISPKYWLHCVFFRSNQEALSLSICLYPTVYSSFTGLSMWSNMQLPFFFLYLILLYLMCELSSNSWQCRTGEENLIYLVSYLWFCIVKYGKIWCHRGDLYRPFPNIWVNFPFLPWRTKLN